MQSLQPDLPQFCPILVEMLYIMIDLYNETLQLNTFCTFENTTIKICNTLYHTYTVLPCHTEFWPKKLFSFAYNDDFNCCSTIVHVVELKTKTNLNIKQMSHLSIAKIMFSLKSLQSLQFFLKLN